MSFLRLMTRSFDRLFRETSEPEPLDPARIIDEAYRSFLLKEYDGLRQEVRDMLQEQWRIEKMAFGGAAVIFAWLFTRNDSANLPEIVWWIPTLLLTFSAARFGSGMVHVAYRCSVYLRRIETFFLGAEGGWEAWFAKQSLNQTRIHYCIWLFGIALSLVPPLSHLYASKVSSVH